MYKCDCCGIVFDTHEFITKSTMCFGDIVINRECVCPACFQGSFHEIEECPVCGKYMDSGEKICESCEANLKEKLSAFTSGLSESELDRLDEILEGESVHNFKEDAKNG